MAAHRKLLLLAVLALAPASQGCSEAWATAFPRNIAGLQAGSYGPWVYLGTIDATNTAKTNAEATTPFGNSGDNMEQKMLLVQLRDASTNLAYILPVTASTGDVTSANGIQLVNNERFGPFSMGSYGYLSTIMSASTGNLVFWELK